MKRTAERRRENAKEDAGGRDWGHMFYGMQKIFLEEVEEKRKITANYAKRRE